MLSIGVFRIGFDSVTRAIIGPREHSSPQPPGEHFPGTPELLCHIGSDIRSPFDSVENSVENRLVNNKEERETAIIGLKSSQAYPHEAVAKLTSCDVDTMPPADTFPEIGEPRERATTDRRSLDSGGDK